MIKKLFRNLLNRNGYDIIKTAPGVAHKLGNSVEPEFFRWLRNRPIKTILDVGANEGQFAFEALGIWPEVTIHSFEPLEKPSEILENKSKNESRIIVHKFALGDINGAAEIHVNASSASSSLLKLDENHQQAFPKAVDVSKQNIKVKTLDSIFKKLTCESQIVLKLDVQGFEYKVLQGALSSLSEIDYIICELSFQNLYKGQHLALDIIDELEKRHFRFLGNVEYLNHPVTGLRLQADGFFVHRKHLDKR